MPISTYRLMCSLPRAGVLLENSAGCFKQSDPSSAREDEPTTSEYQKDIKKLAFSNFYLSLNL